MFGGKFLGAPPFRQVYIHGLVRDSKGKKMSKSKGNVLDPIDLIDGIALEELVQKRTRGLLNPKDAAGIEAQTRRDFPDGIANFGADALRFTFVALASTGRDINFDLARTAGYRNFCNKIWHAARFVLLHTQGKTCDLASAQPSVAQRWIISQLHLSTAAIHTAIGEYRFDLVAREIHELIWLHYCDWFVELCKPVLQRDDAAAAATRGTLVVVLETLLRLAHPIMPFSHRRNLAGNCAVGETRGRYDYDAALSARRQASGGRAGNAGYAMGARGGACRAPIAQRA